MTDFLRLDMMIASSGSGTWHHIGFDIPKVDWPEFKVELEKVDPGKTLSFRENGRARTPGLNERWCWIWVQVKEETPIAVLILLARAAREHEWIKFRPNEYP